MSRKEYCVECHKTLRNYNKGDKYIMTMDMTQDMSVMVMKRYHEPKKSMGFNGETD